MDGLPPGRLVDLVLAWSQRAQQGAAGELRLWLGRDGGIAVEERWPRPWQPLTSPRRGGDGTLPPDDPPAHQERRQKPCHLEEGAELDAILRLRPGELETWPEELLSAVLPGADAMTP